MNIAFIHFHLNPSGVTTVLKQQVEAIRERCEVLVISGSPVDLPLPFDTVHIPGLGYDSETTKYYPADFVTDAIVQAIFSKWKTGCDILHVHNPTLAKNRNLLKILTGLQQKGLKLFLQIHDFAEDGRPNAYFPDEYLFDCHYGVINSRDYAMLLQAGLTPRGLHLIPNMLTPFDNKDPGLKIDTFVLYPVRAIRRKNIGEAILLSLFLKNRSPVMITLPPNSPADIKAYKDWKKFVKENRLNVLFEAGLTHDFNRLVLSADFLITTSITEGFGFSFLEPWIARKLLWGRSLTDICSDFERNGICLDHLYPRLLVPFDWIGEKRFYTKWRASVLQSCARFNYNIDQRTISEAFASIAKKGCIDFGLLHEGFQQEIISRILTGQGTLKKMIDLNPFLSNPGEIKNKKGLIQNNREAIISHYNQKIYKQRLMNIYSKIITDSVRQRIDKKMLLSQFFNLENFNLLKWCDYDE